MMPITRISHTIACWTPFRPDRLPHLSIHPRIAWKADDGVIGTCAFAAVAEDGLSDKNVILYELDKDDREEFRHWVSNKTILCLGGNKGIKPICGMFIEVGGQLLKIGNPSIQDSLYTANQLAYAGIVGLYADTPNGKNVKIVNDVKIEAIPRVK